MSLPDLVEDLRDFDLGADGADIVALGGRE